MVRCSSPRPETRKTSVSGVSSTRSAMLVRSSFCSRSRTLRDVTYLPSRPASGDVFTWKYIASVGSSTRIGGSASGTSTAASVVPIASSSTPVTSTISPAAALATAVRSRPANLKICPIFARAGTVLSAGELRSTATSCPGTIRPLRMRPMPSRPTQLE